MARQVVQHFRNTRAVIDAKAADNTLFQGEIYLITDESRVAMGTATNAYAECATAAQGAKADSAVQGDGTVLSVVALTQAAYATLTPVSTTLYIITDA